LIHTQHHHNNHTTTPHMRVGPSVWGPPSCEGLLCDCCVGVVNLTFSFVLPFIRKEVCMFGAASSACKGLFGQFGAAQVWKYVRLFRCLNGSCACRKMYFGCCPFCMDSVLHVWREDVCAWLLLLKERIVHGCCLVMASREHVFCCCQNRDRTC